MKYLEKMEQHGLLFATPITQGSYIWRSRGIEIVKKVQKILEASFIHSFPGRYIENIGQEMLIKRSNYDQFFKEINPYCNNFSVWINNVEYFVRPDITYLNGIYLKNTGDIDNKALGGVVDIYRKVKAKALMIDQQIWPLLFFSFADTKRNISENMNGMIQSLSSSYDALLLPHIWTMHNGYEKYADQLAMPMMPEDEKNLTVMSTVFALSDLFSEKLGIDAKLFELGVTEKTFAMIYIYQNGNEYVFLPSTINPTPVVLDNRILNQKVENYLKTYRIGYKSATMKGSIVNKESCQGNSLLLIQGDSGIKMVNLVTREEIALDDLDGISEGLRDSDNKILNGNTEIMEKVKGKNIFKAVCDDCLNSVCNRNGWLFNGDIYPSKSGECISCEKNAKIRMLLSSNANARAKEKSQ